MESVCMTKVINILGVCGGMHTAVPSAREEGKRGRGEKRGQNSYGHVKL